ncbi:DUF4258 domain-containing protein [candidate division NPL-UPA2 bacterium]|nr:DUF4258 domain-containing protein [candidate division NPL-UPA2 bacterium]
MELRFSRHARNKMRWYGVTPEEVEEVIASGKRPNRKGRWKSESKGLRVVWLMVGEYILVVTVIRLR